MFLTILYFTYFCQDGLGCQVLFSNDSDSYADILGGLHDIYFYFIYGYRNIKGEAPFLNNDTIKYFTEGVPFLYTRKTGEPAVVAAHTKTDLDGIWKLKVAEPFQHKYKDKTIIHFNYKYSKDKEMAIVLTTCEFSTYFEKPSFKIRKYFYFFTWVRKILVIKSRKKF